MSFWDVLGASAGHKVTIQTRLTPPITFDVGPTGAASSGEGSGLELGPLLRPKITVDGFEIAPYGEPEEWIVYVEAALLIAFGLYLANKL